MNSATGIANMGSRHSGVHHGQVDKYDGHTHMATWHDTTDPGHANMDAWHAGIVF